MKWYEVTIHVSETISTYVEADNKEEAEQKAIKESKLGSIDYVEAIEQ